MAGIDGEWDARKLHCACGYEATWMVREDGDTLTVTEQPGAKCCGFVPNCFRKTHRMQAAGANEWRGRLGGKNIKLVKVSDTELEHQTTDGMMQLTRSG